MSTSYLLKRERTKIRHHNASNQQSCLIGLLVGLINHDHEIITFFFISLPHYKNNSNDKSSFNKNR